MTEISQYNHSFSFIGLAETNIDSDLNGLYRIPGYVSEYNNKMAGKSKGTGVGIYIKDCFSYTRMDKLCKCTANLESIFISVSNTDQPQTVGVLYRPPGGVGADFIKEFEEILCELPNKNVTLLGDFNFNLFDKRAHSGFENVLYSNNMIPVISVTTHEKPGCEASLIDNILTNSTDNLIVAGVLASREKHKFFEKSTNFYLQHLKKKNKLSNIYVLFSTLEEESVGCFAHPSRRLRARGTARASVHSSSQCLHTRGKRTLGTTQRVSRQHTHNITINLAITKIIHNSLCPCYGSLQRARRRTAPRRRRRPAGRQRCPARKKDGTET